MELRKRIGRSTPTNRRTHTHIECNTSIRFHSRNERSYCFLCFVARSITWFVIRKKDESRSKDACLPHTNDASSRASARHCILYSHEWEYLLVCSTRSLFHICLFWSFSGSFAEIQITMSVCARARVWGRGYVYIILWDDLVRKFLVQIDKTHTHRELERERYWPMTFSHSMRWYVYM